MPKKLEVILTVQNEKPSIQFHVSDVVEGPAKEKFMELLKDMPIPEAVLDSLSELSQARFLPAEEVEVQDVSPKFVQQSKPRSGSAQKAKKDRKSVV